MIGFSTVPIALSLAPRVTHNAATRFGMPVRDTNPLVAAFTTVPASIVSVTFVFTYTIVCKTYVFVAYHVVSTDMSVETGMVVASADALHRSTAVPIWVMNRLRFMVRFGLVSFMFVENNWRQSRTLPVDATG